MRKDVQNKVQGGYHWTRSDNETDREKDGRTKLR